MSDLLVPPLALDDRSRAIDALAARMTGLDLTPILVYLIDLVPADALPILAEQFNVVGPLWAYLPDEAAKRRAIKESVTWHRAKGTPWSVETALSWAGHVAKVEDTTGTPSRWAEYQIELATPVSDSSFKAVLELARFAAPARSHLVRLYGGYDLRRITLSAPEGLSDGMLSDESGVLLDGVKLSFGTRHAFAQSVAASLSGSQTHSAGAHVFGLDLPRLSVWKLDSELVGNHQIAISQLIGMNNRSGAARRIAVPADGWSPSVAAGIAWETAGAGWAEVDWRLTGDVLDITVRPIARASLPLSEAEPLGVEWVRLPGGQQLAMRPHTFGDPLSALNVEPAAFPHDWVDTFNRGLWAAGPGTPTFISTALATRMLQALVPEGLGLGEFRLDGEPPARNHGIGMGELLGFRNAVGAGWTLVDTAWDAFAGDWAEPTDWEGDGRANLSAQLNADGSVTQWPGMGGPLQSIAAHAFATATVQPSEWGRLGSEAFRLPGAVVTYPAPFAFGDRLSDLSMRPIHDGRDEVRTDYRGLAQAITCGSTLGRIEGRGADAPRSRLESWCDTWGEGRDWASGRVSGGTRRTDGRASAIPYVGRDGWCEDWDTRSWAGRGQAWLGSWSAQRWHVASSDFSISHQGV